MGATSKYKGIPYLKLGRNPESIPSTGIAASFHRRTRNDKGKEDCSDIGEEAHNDSSFVPLQGALATKQSPV